MTQNKNCLNNIKEHKEKVYFADGSFVESKYIGTFIGYINENKVKFKDVLYIPEFKRSLSIENLCNSNYKLIFYRKQNKNLVTIYNNKGNRLYTVSSNKSKI